MNAPSLTDSGLAGAVAIVTGGSRGIGRAIVEVLAASGMEVIFTYRENAVAAAEVAASVAGAKITAEKVDVRDAAASFIIAMKKGKHAERYLLGGPNWTFAKFFERLDLVGYRTEDTSHGSPLVK